jgi:hypothetical protein
MVEHAVALARLGWAVYPLHYPIETSSPARPYGRCSCHQDCETRCGKHPITATVEPTADEKTIRALWKLHPRANIAVRVPNESFFVVDVDPRKGGDVEWERIREANDPLPTTVYALTGSDGLHELYRRPPGVRLRSFVAEGIDLPTTHFVAPPSLHFSGKRYAWVHSPWDYDIAEPPAWLVRMITAPTVEAAQTLPLPTLETSTDRLLVRARAYLATMDPAISGCGGHNATIRAAGALVGGFGLSTDDALALLLEEYNARCKPPWSVKDLRHKVEDAAKRATGSPHWLANSLGADRSSSPGRGRPVGGIAPPTYYGRVWLAEYERLPAKGCQPECCRVELRLETLDGVKIKKRETIETRGACYEATLGEIPADAWAPAHAPMLETWWRKPEALQALEDRIRGWVMAVTIESKNGKPTTTWIERDQKREGGGHG